MRSDQEVEDKARSLFAWAFPPDSDREDEWRKRDGKKQRDWEPTRDAARKQTRRMLAEALCDD